MSKDVKEMFILDQSEIEPVTLSTVLSNNLAFTTSIIWALSKQCRHFKF